MHPSLTEDAEYYGDAIEQGLNKSSRHYNNEGFLLFDENDPSYYSLNYKIVGTLFQGLILLFELLGNLLVVVVVFRTRSMHSTTNCKPCFISIDNLHLSIEYWLGFKHLLRIIRKERIRQHRRRADDDGSAFFPLSVSHVFSSNTYGSCLSCVLINSFQQRYIFNLSVIPIQQSL